MINVRNLLDDCGIAFREDQLTRLEKLLNDMIQKYIKENCSDQVSVQDYSGQVIVGYTIKQEDFYENNKTKYVKELANSLVSIDVSDVKKDIVINDLNILEQLKNPKSTRDRGKRDFECDQCLQTFKSKQRLVKHITTYHEGKTPFRCCTCGNGFCNEITLKNHIACKHEGKKVYQG